MIKTPGEGLLATAGIAFKIAAAEVSDFTEVALPDEIPGVLNHRGPTVVEAHQVQHAALLDHPVNGHRLPRSHAHGFLTEDVLPRRAAALTMASWLPLGVVTLTASIRSFSIRESQSVV